MFLKDHIEARKIENFTKCYEKWKTLAKGLGAPQQIFAPGSKKRCAATGVDEEKIMSGIETAKRLP